MVMAVTVEPLTGPAFQAALDDLASLRIRVFRDFPYLYDGTRDYEAKYLGRLANAKDGIIVAARDGDRVVGCATGSALSAHHEEFGAPFRAAGYDLDDFFYCGESVLLHEYRGQGIGHVFLDQREAHARACGYKRVTFCAVVRPADLPLKPANFRSLDGFWERRGYRRVEGMVTEFAWKDIDQDVETAKPMQFWMREL